MHVDDDDDEDGGGGGGETDYERKVLYRGTLRLKKKESGVDSVALDNDPVSLARDHRRLSDALRRVTDGDVTIEDTKRDNGEIDGGGGEEDDVMVSDLFILSERSLQHEPAVRRYLTQNEDEVRYSLVKVEHMMPPRPNRSTRPVLWTLAIRRRALRPISRLVWLRLPIKLFFLFLGLYCLFLLYRLVRAG